jgi:selenocysteine-specific elongation factor
MANRRFILGTAGHVDHGKTQLVNRLTGWDTDRLKEEKERGISIELGFAPLKVDDDTMVGIVDVPGHERFVKNMVAGAGGIDMALLVVAADEGVMPQTREHLEVLRSLSVTHGVVVITKTDLASPDTKAILGEDIAELVKNTFLENAPIVETSAVTGEGVDDLKRTIKEIAERIPQRDRTGPFRLAIDRVFHKQGIGVVVTGSCYTGTVSVGDSIQLLPSEKNVRVREIQSFGDKRQHGYAGERLAVALQGGKLSEVSRGDMLVAPSHFAVSYMVDARLSVAGYAKFELKQRERVRLHHGAREVLGRLILLETDKMRSGDQSLVQMRLETPIVAGEGDYFVLRKYSPSRVVGGGRVIDPRANKHRVNDSAAVANLKMLERGDPNEKIIKQAQAAGVAGLSAAAVDEKLVQELVGSGRIVAIDKLIFGREALEVLHKLIHELAAGYNKKFPLRYGIDKEELKQRVRFPHPTSAFNRVLEYIAEFGGLFIKDILVRADTEDIELPEDTSKEIDHLENIIRRAGFLFQKRAEIAPSWRGRGNLAESLQFLRDAGRIHKVGDDAFIHGDALVLCLGRLREWFETKPSITVPEFKNLLEVTRKQAIPLLEYLDANRYTARRENVRLPGARLRDSR